MQGKVVVITGASRGIGAAAVRQFAAAGARVAALARSGPAIEALAGQIGAQVMPIVCDVSSWPQTSAAMEAVSAKWGRIDVLVNNAGQIEPIARIADAAPQDWAQAVQVNLAGAFHAIRAVLPHMKAAGGGTIINVSSGAATSPYEGWSAYCAAKAGVLMLTRSLHLEEGPTIRALGLSPGTVATDMQRRISASGINPVSGLAWEDHIPTEWPARALVWMCEVEADPWLGQDVRLRDEDIRRKVGLMA